MIPEVNSAIGRSFHSILKSKLNNFLLAIALFFQDNKDLPHIQLPPTSVLFYEIPLGKSDTF